jgi:uncharacterized protein YukE
MALKVKSFAQIAEASANLNKAATDYQTALEAVRKLVDETESMWIGDDADAYRNKIREAIGIEKPLDKVGKEIQSHAKTLSDTSAILAKVSANIKTAMS